METCGLLLCRTGQNRTDSCRIIQLSKYIHTCTMMMWFPITDTHTHNLGLGWIGSDWMVGLLDIVFFLHTLAGWLVGRLVGRLVETRFAGGWTPWTLWMEFSRQPVAWVMDEAGLGQQKQQQQLKMRGFELFFLKTPRMGGWINEGFIGSSRSFLCKVLLLMLKG